MNLKTSLFNKSVIKSDFKRFWWVSAVLMIFMALFVLPNTVADYLISGGNRNYYYRTDEGLLVFATAFFLAGMIFSYLHKSNAVSNMHGIPVTRKTQYLSHILAGGILIFIPVFISSAAIGFECIYAGAEAGFALKYFYTCSVYAALAFMMTVFAVMITGNTIAAYVFSAGIMIFPAFLISITDYILHNNLYGYTSDLSGLYEKIYLMGIDNIWSKSSVLYIIIILILLAASWILYKIRELESCEEIVVFKHLRPVFMYAAALCFGYAGGVAINEIWEVNTLFIGSLPLGCAALIAAFMLNQKSFSIKGLFKPLCVFVVITAVVKLGFVFDITGYEKRIPDINEVESIEPYNNIAENTYGGFYNYDERQVITQSEKIDRLYNGKITDKNIIGDMEKLHKKLITDRNTKRNDDYNLMQVKLKYNLKNGTSMEREYSIKESDYIEDLKAYYETAEYKKALYPFISDNDKEINYVNYANDIFVKSDIQLKYIDYDKLAEALKKDIMSFNYKEISEAKRIYNGTHISINYTEYINVNGKDYRISNDFNIELNRYFENTNKLISEEIKKYTPMLKTEEDLISVHLSVYGEDYNYDSLSEITADINESEEIKKIFKAYMNNGEYVDDSETNTDYYTVDLNFATSSGNDYNVSICKPYNEIPVDIRKYIK